MNPSRVQRLLLLLTLCSTASLIADPLKPLFENSVVSNDIDFIHSGDPTTDFEISFSGRKRMEMPDKRSNELFANDTYVFRGTFADGAAVDFWCAPDFASEAIARSFVKKVATALGKLPAALRKTLHHVVIHSGDEVAFSEEQGRFFVLYSENIDKRISQHDLEETVFHETIHATLEAEHANAPGWIAAQKSDPGFITEYAERHPQKEDLPESALFAYCLIYHPERLPETVRSGVALRIPARVEYLRHLFETMKPTEK